jgi:drug/metabolite transporter (DMT)-like permease
MKNEKEYPVKWILLILLALIWGSSFILMKKGLTAFAPDQVAAIRIGIACLATIPLVAGKMKELPRKSIPYIAVIGLFGSGIPAFLFATAQTRINSSLAGMLNGLTPLFTMLLGGIFFRTNFTSRQIAGVFVGFLGAAGLIFVRSDGQIGADSGYAFLIVIATLFYGLSVNTIKSHLGEVNSFVISGVSLMFVGIPYLIYLFATDFTYRLQHVEGAGTAFASVMLLGLMGTAVSNVLYFQMVKISSPLFASAVTYLIPVVALAWGLGDGEALHPIHLLAMGAILGGIALISRKPVPAKS